VGCISTVGFIPAVNGEAFSLSFRKKSTLSDSRERARRVLDARSKAR